MRPFQVPGQRPGKRIFTTLMVILIIFSASTCGTPPTQQQAGLSKAQFDQQLAHAQSIGVPPTTLQPVLHESEQLSGTHAPLTVFNDQAATDYYANLARRYQVLTIQVRGLEAQVTEQVEYQAALDLQELERVLAERQAQGFIEAKTFAEQLTQEQQLLALAHYPKDYLSVSSLAKRSTQALRLMGPASTQLTSLRQVITQMDASHLDTTALKQEAADDLQLFRSARQPEDFVLLIDQITAQLQTATTFSVQAIPYLGAVKLEQLRADIELAQRYGQDVSGFRQRLEADKTALARAMTMGDYLQVAAQIEHDLASIQLPKMRGQATFLLKQYHQEVRRWGQAHTYHDPFNGVTYRLDYEYDQQGIGTDLDAVVSSAQTLDDYQAAVELIQHAFVHVKAMEADATDKTPWNRPHASDLQLMDHYQLRTGQVLVISLLEQAARLYQDGKLVKSFQITTGQYERPTPPGRWEVFRRESPTVFKSGEPEGSAFWYPDTNINYAMEFHEGGYFIHDSWWRADYGVGTNFPHDDSGGDQFFAGNGSHGCVNMVPADAAWLYTHTGYGLPVLIY